MRATRKIKISGEGSMNIQAVKGMAIFVWLITFGTDKHALAIDTQPGDFIAAPPGTTGVVFYGNYGTSDGAVVNGKSISGNLDTYVGAPRVVHFFDVGGFTADMNLMLPVGSLQNASLGGVSLGKASGVGDLNIVGTFWFIDEPKTNRYLALAGYLSIPTGNYDPFAPLNMGANRWSGALQLGGIYGLTDRWFIEGVTDITVYGNNSNYDGFHGVMSQDPTITAQTWLTFKATDRVNLSVGYGAYWGGAQALNGTNLGFNSEKQQVRAAVALFVTPTFQVLGQVNHDFAVQGGFDQGFSSLIRVMQLF